jgi:hypothetical protein
MSPPLLIPLPLPPNLQPTLHPPPSTLQSLPTSTSSTSSHHLSQGVGEALNKIACDFNSDLFPASSPYVLAIGGTAWPDGDPAKQRGWGDRSGASGGGFAMQWPMPEYQKDVVDAYLKVGQQLEPLCSWLQCPGCVCCRGAAYMPAYI